MPGNDDLNAIKNEGAFTTEGVLTFDIDGNADFHDHRLKNVSDPTAAQDAATKAYVDAATLTASGDLASLALAMAVAL